MTRYPKQHGRHTEICVSRIMRPWSYINDSILVYSILFMVRGGVLPEKLGRGVRPPTRNPYPIYDQNMRFPYPIYDLTKNFIFYGLILISLGEGLFLVALSSLRSMRKTG